MGREIIVNRLDLLEDGTYVLKDYDDTYICGRTDFTGEIARLFYRNDGVYYLVVDFDKLDSAEKLENENYKLNVTFDNPAFDDGEFEFNVVKREDVMDSCVEYINKYNWYVREAEEKLEDAREARKRSANLEVFEDFSNLIDSLYEYINDFYSEASVLKEDIERVENEMHEDVKTGKVQASYIVLILSE